MSQIKTSHSDEKLEQSLIETINFILRTTGDHCTTFNVGLSGGSVINVLSNILPKLQTDLKRWRFFFCDERLVPIDNAESTYGTYIKQFSERQLQIDFNQFYKVNEQLNGEECAENYANLIEQNVPKNADGVPAFDLLFLGKI
jgi:6-phosphogluconolactonase